MPHAGLTSRQLKGRARHESRGVTLVVLSLSVLIINLDGTILNVALPSIVRDLHATSTQLQWVVDAYIIVLAGLLLIAGSLGDHWGRKRVFLVGLAIFAAGSALSAFSTSTDSLIAARAFMGVGGAAVMPSTLSILTNVFKEPHDRARAIGLWSGTNGLGLALGPLIGGWLLAHYWWGSVFLINVPIAVVTGITALIAVPDSRNADAATPDVIGAVLSLIGVSSLLWGIIEAPSRGWTSPLILGALLGSVVVFAALVWFETRSTHPLVELSFFSKRRFSVAMGGLALTLFALSGTMFLLTQYLQFSLGYSPFQTGLRITPIALVLIVVASVSTTLARYAGAKVVVVAGMALIALGLQLLSAVTIHTTYTDALPAFFLLGIGSGLAIAPCTDAVMGSVPTKLAGIGSATNSTALQIGSALGVAVIGSLLAARYQSRVDVLIAGHGAPASVVAVIRSSLGGALAVAQRVGGASGAQLALAARSSFLAGLDFAVDVAAAIVGAAALIVAVLLPARAPAD